METTELKTILDGLRGSVSGFATSVKSLEDRMKNFQQLQTQVDAIDAKLQGHHSAFGGAETTDAVEVLLKSFDEHRESFQKSGRLILETPSLLSVSAQMKTVTSTGIAPQEREPGIGRLGRKTYRLRSFLTSQPTEAASIQFIRETAFTNAASPQVEAGDKLESTFTFEAVERSVRTLAHWTACSKQVLDDVVEMGNHISSSLIYGLEELVETELISGSGAGEHLEGFLTVGTAFNTALLSASAGWSKVDILRKAALQLELAGYDCTGFVLSPTDWSEIELAKDGEGRYLIGDPRGGQIGTTLWGRPVCVSAGMTTGTFLAGDFTRAGIRQRQTATVDISTEHSDYFTKNKVAIRAEERLVNIIRRPEAFVYGSLVTSPA